MQPGDAGCSRRCVIREATGRCGMQPAMRRKLVAGLISFEDATTRLAGNVREPVQGSRVRNSHDLRRVHFALPVRWNRE